MKTLCIDTSSNVCSVALLEDDKLIKELNINDSKTHSENLMPLVSDIFKETNLTLSGINLIACSIGPGSFTGIRIGIASCKAMAEVHNLPIVGVTSLETLCYNESNFEVICSLIDAKNDNVYCGIFDKNYNLLEDYLSENINSVVNTLSKYSNILFVGDGSLAYKDILQNSLTNITFSEKNTQSAFSLGKCAYKKYLKGEVVSADTLLPLYLRKSSAERNLK